MPEMIDTRVLFVTALDGKGTKIDQKKLKFLIFIHVFISLYLDVSLVVELDFEHVLHVKAVVDSNGFYSSKSSSRTTGKTFSRNPKIFRTNFCESVRLRIFLPNKILE